MSTATRARGNLDARFSNVSFITDLEQQTHLLIWRLQLGGSEACYGRRCRSHRAVREPSRRLIKRMSESRAG